MYYTEFAWIAMIYVISGHFILHIVYLIVDMKVHGYESTKLVLKYQTSFTDETSSLASFIINS